MMLKEIYIAVWVGHMKIYYINITVGVLSAWCSGMLDKDYGLMVIVVLSN